MNGSIKTIDMAIIDQFDEYEDGLSPGRCVAAVLLVVASLLILWLIGAF